MKWLNSGLAGATLLAASVAGQLSVPGRFAPSSLGFGHAAVELEQLDNDVLRAHEGPSDGGFQFGLPRDVELNVADECTWFDVEGGRACRYEIVSLGALSINLLFKKFWLPSGAELFVVGQEDILGAFTAELNNKDDETFATFPISGDRVLLEYIVPNSVTEQPKLVIDKVVHGYKAINAESGKCNIDVACKVAQPWKKQVDSVAVMITDNGSKYCSGAMINNEKNPGQQLFLTAYHCVGSSSIARHLLGFHYESDTCRGPLPPMSRRPIKTVQGLNLLAKSSASDFALFEVKETIPDEWDVYLSGWNSGKDLGVGAVGIHHPATDVKKISFYNGTLVEWCWGASCRPTQAKDHWKVQPWTFGTTEPGSSGSPIFDRNQRVVGQLHGGSASCRNAAGWDAYGGIFASWTGAGTPTSRLVDHLVKSGSTTTFIDGVYLKDARQQGSNGGGSMGFYLK